MSGSDPINLDTRIAAIELQQFIFEQDDMLNGCHAWGPAADAKTGRNFLWVKIQPEADPKTESCLTFFKTNIPVVTLRESVGDHSRGHAISPSVMRAYHDSYDGEGKPRQSQPMTI